jgi:hypothetical protein
VATNIFRLHLFVRVVCFKLNMPGKRPPRRGREVVKRNARDASRSRSPSPPPKRRDERPGPEMVISDPLPHVPIPLDQSVAMGRLLTSMSDLQDAQTTLIAGQSEMRVSHQSLSDRMTTMARRQDCAMAAGGELQGPAGKTAAAMIRETQHLLLEGHAAHSRSDVLQAVDNAMSKLGEFLKLVKRADSTEKGWFVAAKYVQLGSVGNFEEGWTQAERSNDAAVVAWARKAKSRSAYRGQGGSLASTQSFDPAVGQQFQSYNSQQAQGSANSNSMGQAGNYSREGANYPRQEVNDPPRYGNSRPPKDLSTTRCYFCNQMGHLAYSCTLKASFLRAQQDPVNANSLPVTQNAQSHQ